LGRRCRGGPQQERARRRKEKNQSAESLDEATHVPLRQPLLRTIRTRPSPISFALGTAAVIAFHSSICRKDSQHSSSVSVREARAFIHTIPHHTIFFIFLLDPHFPLHYITMFLCFGSLEPLGFCWSVGPLDLPPFFSSSSRPEPVRTCHFSRIYLFLLFLSFWSFGRVGLGAGKRIGLGLDWIGFMGCKILWTNIFFLGGLSVGRLYVLCVCVCACVCVDEAVLIERCSVVGFSGCLFVCLFVAWDG
jgi:hypothetical protein